MLRSLEIPIESVEEACLAAPHVDRLEVCVDLQADGWTPSSETLAAIVQAVSDCSVQVVSLIRPRCCPDFIVSKDGFSQAARDIEAASRSGADGVVFGFLNQRMELDPVSSARLCELARSLGLSASLHRVSDFDADFERMISVASECGCDRILTSGASGWSFESTSLDKRISRIEELVRSSARHGSRLARSPVRIIACGGVRAGNARGFLGATPDLHASCRSGGRFDVGLLDDLVALRHA